MRTAARRQDDASLDMIFDAGQRARDLEIVQGQLEEAKRKLAPPPLRKRVWGIVSSILLLGFTSFVFYLIGEYRALTILSNRAGQPLSTASMPTRTALPTAPYAPPAASGGDEAPPAYEDAIATYNAQQQATAQAWEATQEAPGATGGEAADNEAAIEAWLAAPVSTATPLPEPGAPGFAESFSDAPACSSFIGYLPGSECYALAQTATAGE